MSKQALKNKKKRDAKKLSKGNEADGGQGGGGLGGGGQELPKLPIAAAGRNKLALSLSGGDSEAEKKTKGIAKKLEQITKLKELQASGTELEKNQLEKISKEDELRHELESLML